MNTTADMAINHFRNFAHDNQKAALGVTDADTRTITLKNDVLWRLHTKQWIAVRKVKYGIKT